MLVHVHKDQEPVSLPLPQNKDSFNSGSNVSMIKRSAYPKGNITKLLGDIKLVRTLAGHLKTQKVVTM
jgi:hypothetical protein